jgi:hypothetical protein
MIHSAAVGLRATLFYSDIGRTVIVETSPNLKPGEDGLGESDKQH